jgi:predicted permease
MDPALVLIAVSLSGGFLVGRARLFPSDAADTLNRFVIYVSLPAVVLRLIPKLSLSPGLAVVAIMPWLCAAFAALVVMAAGRVLGFGRDVLGALLLCVPLGNTSFLGFPMVSALLGAESVKLAVLYDQLGSFLILATYGIFVVSRFSGDRPPTTRAVLRRIATFPPFVSLVIASLPLPRPAWTEPLLLRLGDTLVPLALFAVGLRLELGRPRAASALAFGLATKMLVLPVVAFSFARALSASASVLSVTVLESAMPPMITAGAVAAAAGLAPELTAALVGYGVVLSLATLPAIASLVR